jgi:DNA polymerase kappa
MGGPSSGKAGISRDPEETNKIIAEASKDSKYFQVSVALCTEPAMAETDDLPKEVRRRDAQLTERIEALTKKRFELMKVIDLRTHAYLCDVPIVLRLLRSRGIQPELSFMQLKWWVVISGIFSLNAM